MTYEECEGGKCHFSESPDMTDITRPVVCIVSCQWSPLPISTTWTSNAEDLLGRSYRDSTCLFPADSFTKLSTYSYQEHRSKHFTQLIPNLFEMKFFTLAALAPLLVAPITSAYPITGDNVNCRDGPGTSFKSLKTYAKGTDVALVCQTEGTSISGNTIWDKTSDGCYVADYYVKTGSNGYVTDKCTDVPVPCGAPKSNAATVDLIASFEGFRANICEYSQ